VGQRRTWRRASRLQHLAGPAFARAERPAAGKAAACRLAALCLASESDAMQRADIGDLFRQVAAGITLLEYRGAEQGTASEVIMLAVDQSIAVTPAHALSRRARAGPCPAVTSAAAAERADISSLCSSRRLSSRRTHD